MEVCSTWIPVCFLGGYKVRNCFGNNQFLVIVIVVTILIIDIVIQEASIMAYLRTLCCRYLVNTNALLNFVTSTFSHSVILVISLYGL